MQEEKYEPIGKYLSIAYRAFNMLLDDKLAQYDIARGQFPILIALYHKEGISQQELCDIYNLDKAAVGRAVKKLTEKNFIERKRDPEDKRQYCLYLTEKANSFKSKFLSILKSTEEDIKQGLTEIEVEDFMITLKKIVKNLGVSDVNKLDIKED